MTREPEVHPIVVLAARLASPDPQGRVDFSEEALGRLRKDLKELESSDELPMAVTGLVAFAAHLHRDCQSERGGIRLLEVAAEMSGPMRQRVIQMGLARDVHEEPSAKVGQPIDAGSGIEPRSNARPEVRKGRAGVRAADLISQRRLSGKGV